MTERSPNGKRRIVAVQRQRSSSDDSQSQWLALLNDELDALLSEETFSFSCAFVDPNGTRTSLR
ncbi:MAG: hypothetical protein AAF581_00975 [Planctomycetota bacterium]